MGTAVTVLILVLVAQLTYLQIVDAKNLEDNPLNVRAQLRDINRPRGEIVTADGEVAAKSVAATDHTDFKFQRQYPLGSLTSQIVGYQSFVVGNTGIEKTYNDELVGRSSDLQLKNLPDIFSGKEDTGRVVLTVNAALQRLAQQQLGQQRGSVVLLDVKTGGIVAMYSNPSFDPQPLAGHDTKAVNAYFQLLTANTDKPNLPRAYRELYPPGSTFKTVTTAVALDDGVTNPDKTYPFLSSLVLPQTTARLQNFGGETCGGTLVESFVESCNATFGQVGLDLGNQLVPGMARFGIGDIVPLDVAPGSVETLGPVAGSFDNDKPSFAQAAIGQRDVAVTPLQMALVAEAVANGGVIYQPHAAGEIRDANDKTVRTIGAKQWRTAMTPATAQALTAMMEQVVQRGTGTRARVPGITVAGKTGTAQTTPGAPPHAWFIGFAPAEAPRYAVAVLVEHGGNLAHEATGGAVAGPIAAAMLKAALSQ
ncbi:MAG TPA: penicillin-binding transpeptidase domain-containing protein [Acidimicrobiia bacterium]|nr:penicillin-binding transpeptidase domain-containing protein [Acidimicrobiia bacterium]